MAFAGPVKSQPLVTAATEPKRSPTLIGNVTGRKNSSENNQIDDHRQTRPHHSSSFAPIQPPSTTREDRVILQAALEHANNRYHGDDSG